MKLAYWGSALAALTLPVASLVSADGMPPADVAAQVTAAHAELDAGEKAKDEGAIVGAAKKLGGLYKETTDGAVKTSIIKDLVGLLKLKAMTSAKKTGLDQLVATEDGAAAWKALASQYPKDDVDDPEKFNLEIIKAVGLLHPDGAIEILLETFQKSKAADASSAAVTALGNYHKSKRRYEVLESICKIGKNMVPSRSSTKNPSADAQARWATLSSAIGKSLDTLTGDTTGDPVEWFKKVDDAKKDYKKLFKDDEPKK